MNFSQLVVTIGDLTFNMFPATVGNERSDFAYINLRDGMTGAQYTVCVKVTDAEDAALYFMEGADDPHHSRADAAYAAWEETERQIVSDNKLNDDTKREMLRVLRFVP